MEVNELEESEREDKMMVGMGSPEKAGKQQGGQLPE